MAGETMNKAEELRNLADKVKKTELSTYFGVDSVKYKHVSEFNCKYDSEYISPWSKSAHNENANVVVIGQDWSSSNQLSGDLNVSVACRGYDEHFPTNRNLISLLKKYLNSEFSEVYALNAFPFIKSGKARARVPRGHISKTAKDFALPAVKIISPKLVICLGKLTFNAMRKANHEDLVNESVKHKYCATLDEAIRHSFNIGKSKCVAVSHTGSRGTSNRKKGQVDSDWKALGQWIRL
jgi:uracil-DNA glycosylase